MLLYTQTLDALLCSCWRATTLAIYKPRGMTRYGQRKQHRQRTLLVP